jgi:hypothetical protein
MPRAIAEIKAILEERRKALRAPPFSGVHDRHGFNPNQPRVPPGHSDGGEWTRISGFGDAHLATSSEDAHATDLPGEVQPTEAPSHASLAGPLGDMIFAATERPPRLPGRLGALLRAGLLAIEIFRKLGWDLFGPLRGGTVARTTIDGKEVFGTNSGLSAYTREDDAAARAMRSRMLSKYPDVMSTENIGGMPNNVLFHAEATVLLRAARESGGTLAGKILEVVVDNNMCSRCTDTEVLPKLGLELGNPTVTYIDKLKRIKTMKNGRWN